MTTWEDLVTDEILRMKSGEDVPRLLGCPKCDSRGWFLINPFATGGTNGAGGMGNMRKCNTCVAALRYWEAHGCLPAELVGQMDAEHRDSLPLSDKQIEILQHTMRRAPSGKYCGDSPAMQDLVRRGLMRFLGKASWCPDPYFGLTPAGREALEATAASAG